MLDLELHFDEWRLYLKISLSDNGSESLSFLQQAINTKTFVTIVMYLVCSFLPLRSVVNQPCCGTCRGRDLHGSCFGETNKTRR